MVQLLQMTDEMYDEIALERRLKAGFSVELDIDKIILSDTPVSRTAKATLFLTSKKQLYLFVKAQSRLLLDDVQKIVNRMGITPDVYLPPKGRPNYFEEVGVEKFKQVFPGRSNVSADDTRFYRKLAAYNPALILIKQVDGEIYQYDSDSNGKWRLATKFAYRRMPTS